MGPKLVPKLTNSHDCHLRRYCPKLTFRIFEARSRIGGTWDLFRYNPWDQRLCLVQNGELLHAAKSGKFAMESAEIDRLVEKEIRLKSGKALEADLFYIMDLIYLLLIPIIDCELEFKP